MSAPAAAAVPEAFAALTEGVIRMLGLARLKPLVTVAAALILATAGLAVEGRQKPATEGARGGKVARTRIATRSVTGQRIDSHP